MAVVLPSDTDEVESHAVPVALLQLAWGGHLADRWGNDGRRSLGHDFQHRSSSRPFQCCLQEDRLSFMQCGMHMYMIEQAIRK